MPRVLTVPLLLTLGMLALAPLSGCADQLGPGPAGPATALTLPARTAANDTDADTDGDTDRAAPPAGDDLAACFDGDCRVRVPDGTTIRVDPRFEVEGISVSVADGRARIRIDTGTGYVASGSIGSSSVYNDLTVRLLAVEGDTATIELEAD